MFKCTAAGGWLSAVATNCSFTSEFANLHPSTHVVTKLPVADDSDDEDKAAGDGDDAAAGDAAAGNAPGDAAAGNAPGDAAAGNAPRPRVDDGYSCMKRKLATDRLFEVVVMYPFNGLTASTKTGDSANSTAMMHYLAYIIPEADKLHVVDLDAHSGYMDRIK